MQDKVVQKIVQNDYTNIISLLVIIHTQNQTLDPP